MLSLGDWQLDTVSGGAMRSDGGAMFGVVPKPLWERYHPPDELNRIRSATNCVLARRDGLTVLIDTGYGGKTNEKDRERGGLEAGEPLVAGLEALGVSPGEIDLVALSHLHFDHVGGASRSLADGSTAIVFERARFVVQRSEWEDATSGAAEFKGAYPIDHLDPLAACDRLELIEGELEIAPGLRSLPTGGHTRGHQALILRSGKETAIYLADLCPMAAHMPSLWAMAYDAYPLDTRRRKPEILSRAADEGWWVLFDHDPNIAAARIARDPRREFVVTESRAAH